MIKNSKWYKNCHCCNNILYYSNKYKLKCSLENNCKCNSCSKKNIIPSAKSIQKMSDSHRGHECYKLRIGIKFSEERKKNISKSSMGRKSSKEIG